MVLQKTDILRIFIIILCYTVVSCLKIDSKIYFKINKYQPCVQLANATHQIGCTSDMKGNRGTIHLVNFEEDIDWLINDGQYHPYIPLIDSPMFTERNMRKLVGSEKVSGALVILKNSSITQPFLSSSLPSHEFSPDPTCPLDSFGFYNNKPEYANCKKVTWNQPGNGMSMAYYGIPIFSLSDSEEVKNVKDCAKKYNYDNGTGKGKSYPLCQVELKDFMFAAKDTPTCKRKSVMANPIMSTYCDPLGDNNVFGTLYPMVKELEKDSVIMVSTKLDSTGFFHELSPGGDNGVTGIVTLLAVAHALGDYKRNMLKKNIEEKLKPIMFTFFNGEVWDYIGSSRMVWDMEKGKFPYTAKKKDVFNGTIDDSTSISKINMSNIGYFIELTQLGLGGGGVFAHSDPISQLSKPVRDKVDKIMNAFNNSGVAFKEVDRIHNKQPLPPASFQRFLRSRQTIPGVVLADHEKMFVNKFYNSRYDNGENLGIAIKSSSRNEGYKEMNGSLPANLTKLAQAVANALYHLASDGRTPKEKIVVPQNLTADLLYCMIYSANCSRFQEITDKADQLPSLPFQRYISIQNMENRITHIIHGLLSYYTGEWLTNCTGKKESRLPHVISYYKVKQNGSYICVKSTAYMTPAVSPAFELENYTSTEYSTWTESMWNSDMGIQMYLVADPIIEGVILVSGIVIFALSFGLVFFFKRKATILFTPSIVIIN